jgi:hypothetical protein
MTKDELIAEVRATARRLGTNSLQRKDFDHGKKRRGDLIKRHFGSWAAVCAAAGLAPACVCRLSDAEVFAAMREAFDALGGVPVQRRFLQHFATPSTCCRTAGRPGTRRWWRLTGRSGGG